jgi:hypothetical protein
MKRYLLFAGENYYPLGGWFDYEVSFDTVDEAIAAVPASAEWWHVVDTQSAYITARGGKKK